LRNKVFFDHYDGFREKHSVVPALLDITSLEYDAIQNNHHTGFLFMDLRKDFDTVSHRILL